MSLSMHTIRDIVCSKVPGLTDIACREIGKDCMCFSATRDGRRFSITVDEQMIPSLSVFGGMVLLGAWDDYSIAAYIAREIEK
jgi:hypothetical protein